MVEKISVNVKILSLNTEHNFLVPSEMCVGDAISLIVKILIEQYPEAMVKRLNEYSLMHLLSGDFLNPNCSFKQLEIVQGEKLLLV